MNYRTALPLAFIALQLCACPDMLGEEESTPGDDLGKFVVTATLKNNTCGEGAFQLKDPWSFDVQLSKDGSTLYWNNGASRIQGSLASDGATFSFSSQVAQQSGQKSDGSPICVLQRYDVARGTLVQSNGKVASFSGSLSYSFAQSQGSRCEKELLANNVLALPCTMEYLISASPK